MRRKGLAVTGSRDDEAMAHDRVLAWAAAARNRRDEVVASVARPGQDGGPDLAAVLAERDDPLVGQIKLVVVVQAVPGVGKVLSRRVLARLGLEDLRLADLRDADADALLAALSAAGG